MYGSPPPQRHRRLQDAVRRRLGVWRRIGAPKHVLRWLQEGVRVEWENGPPEPFHHGVTSFTPAEREWLTGERDRCLGTGAWRRATCFSFVSRAFIVTHKGKRRLVVDLRPDHGRATFWMMPEKDGLEEEVGVIEGLPLRKVALHPFISLIDTGDVWELSDLTRRYDIEGDWIERAGFQECKAELASRSVDTEGIFEDQLESLRNLLREAIAREEAQEKARQHQAELDAAAEAERQEAARLEAEKEAKAQAERDAVDPNLVGCKTDGSVRVFVTGFGEGVYHKFHKPSRWAKDKTTLHTIILDNGEEVTKPWSECSVVEPSGSEGSGPDVSGSDSGGSGSDDEDDAQPEAEHMGPEPEPELEPESGEG